MVAPPCFGEEESGDCGEGERGAVFFGEGCKGKGLEVDATVF